MANIQQQFLNFANYGIASKNSVEMESKNFVKMCKDCGLLDKTFTTTDCDLIFTKCKVKGAKKMTQGDFMKALDEIAAKKKTTKDAIIAKICGGSAKSNATQADYVKFHDDKTLYTGVYANGGPTNVDSINCMAAGNLAVSLDRSNADKRGVKLAHK